MHPDQTEEMKGWMQLAILAYHMTGAEQVRDGHVTMHSKGGDWLIFPGSLDLYGR